ncbi:BrnT family toxin [Aliirhizobium smilacinae]|uniref:BrnT family toxin n=1 Tax=Aliirhizobium smilacinae TaxID=1395944 RepID=A0A5C4XS71_9HYPH|nr:BrnT family toxin [Rhizobium smilacinae]TNM65891.1 hypothetical protein FHP24_06590 [Rhizobium smilacinae]
MVRFVWDEIKRQKNIALHGLDFAVAAAEFDFKEALIEPGYPGRDGRHRFMAIGPLGDDLTTIVFSRLGNEAISIISFRRASRSERRRYAET